ncbi:MAG: glycosyltransferase family protein [Magnetococcales bacterium]|nr:glycosyltransferase family protein [Magnetococcales bacterium]
MNGPFAAYRRGAWREALAGALRDLGVEADPAGRVALLNLAGACAMQLGDFDQAEACWQEVVRLQPGHADTWHNLAVLHRERQHPAEAEAACREALRARPDFDTAWRLLGDLLQGRQAVSEAETAYREALRCRPECPDTLHNLACLMVGAQRFDEAERLLRETLRLAPAHVLACNSLGNLLKARGRTAEAEAAYREALRLRPGLGLAWNNLGCLLREGGRREEAGAALREAVRLEPTRVEAWYNLGELLHEQRRLAEAEAAYREALRLRPDYGAVSWDLALLLLQTGRFAEGWERYEFRYRPENHRRFTPPLEPSFPPWQGEDLAGGALLVIGEQGLGDAIQFARFLPLLAARGVGHLTLACAPSLVTWMAGLSGLDRVVSGWRDGLHDPVPDRWVFLLSLPRHLGAVPTTMPARLSFSSVPSARDALWESRLPTGRLRVGLVWKGNPTHKNDAQRSLPGLRALAPLWSVPGVVFVSLQKGAGAEEAAAPPEDQPLTDLGRHIEDFADTAAIVARLDLVVAVDTAVVHLCGALGRPCWVLLPFIGLDWRWPVDGTPSPWYPQGVRPFHQERPGEWTAPIGRITWELVALLPQR